MTLKELIATFREDADDNEKKQLWSDVFLKAAANRAEAEACKGGLLLKDSTTAEVCQYDLVSGDTIIALDVRIIRIIRAKLSTEAIPLELVTVSDMDECFPGWENATTNKPLRLITDIETGKVGIYPGANAVYTLNLHVYRTPLEEMKDFDDSPEIPDIGSNHRKLVNWMLFEAYSKHDVDQYDPVKAAQHRIMFERDFGMSTPLGANWRKQFMGRSLLTGTFP